VARTRAEFVDALKALATHTAHPKLKTGRRSVAKEPKVAFVFSGHGSQWLGMGRSLLETEPVFRASIEASDKALRKYTDWSLLKQLLAAPEESRLSENDVVQPVLF